MFTKFLVTMVSIICCVVFTQRFTAEESSKDISASVQQLNEPNRHELMQNHADRNNLVMGVWMGVLFMNVIMWASEAKHHARKLLKVSPLLLLLFTAGCRKPFEPIKLEVIEPHEVGFLISNENVKDQSTTSPEDFTSNMVNSQQVKIPQMWIQLGYETMGYNGEWRDAARFIKVDRSSVTREWTADPNSGTSAKNEAIWVMTSDQVEFSTGWSCTAKIDTRADAAKFLANYKNGSLEQVMDQEIRAKLATEFGLNVTDMPMDALRKGATPILTKTVTDVKAFFLERGITITNLGITGGFVYKDAKIIAKMVEVFTAEQEKSIAIAKTVAQEEMNKQILLAAKSKAEAILAEKEAEAQGIQAVADAKAYEIEKAQQSEEFYLKLKEIEVRAKGLEKWDGKYPVYMMGSGQGINMLMPIPEPPKQATAAK